MSVIDYKQQLLDVLAEYKQLGIADQIDYSKFYLYSIITHSTAIEGSTITEIENQLLFDEGISANGRSIQEQMMNLDLKSAYECAIRWATEKKIVTVDMLKSLSAIVMKNTGTTYSTLSGSFDSSKGDLRLVNVTAGVGGRSYMNYLKVPARLKEFCQQMNDRQQDDLSEVFDQYILSFDAHYQLVTIHPWVDGNGRMSRLLMNYVQFEYGLIPTKVKKDDKAEYIQALVDSREQHSLEPFREFMMKMHIRNLQEEIHAFKESMDEDDVKVDSKSGQQSQKVDSKPLSRGEQTRLHILDLIAQNKYITSTEMAKCLGINRSAVSKHLKKLTEDGAIQRVGSDKSGYWKILLIKYSFPSN